MAVFNETTFAIQSLIEDLQNIIETPNSEQLEYLYNHLRGKSDLEREATLSMNNRMLNCKKKLCKRIVKELIKEIEGRQQDEENNNND